MQWVESTWQNNLDRIGRIENFIATRRDCVKLTSIQTVNRAPKECGNSNFGLFAWGDMIVSV